VRYLWRFDRCADVWAKRLGVWAGWVRLLVRLIGFNSALMTMPVGDERGEECDAERACGRAPAWPVDDRGGRRPAIRVRAVALGVMTYRC
jgi:hypothetical protein